MSNFTGLCGLVLACCLSEAITRSTKVPNYLPERVSLRYKRRFNRFSGGMATTGDRRDRDDRNNRNGTDKKGRGTTGRSVGNDVGRGRRWNAQARRRCTHDVPTCTSVAYLRTAFGFDRLKR
jgi:hypothetical protein